MRRAWGFAAAYKNTGLGGGAPDKAGAEVELYRWDPGSPHLLGGIRPGIGDSSTNDRGGRIQRPPEQVKVLVMDTDRTPDGGPTTASRQTYVTGNAARLAAQTLRQAVASTLAEKYDLPPEQIRFVEGLAQVNGHSVSFGEAARAMLAEGRAPARCMSIGRPPRNRWGREAICTLPFHLQRRQPR